MFKQTNIRDGLKDLFEFETCVQVSPLEDYDGGISEMLTETQFEFKCYLENHKKEFATNINQSINFSCYSEYEVNDRK